MEGDFFFLKRLNFRSHCYKFGSVAFAYMSFRLHFKTFTTKV